MDVLIAAAAGVGVGIIVGMLGAGGGILSVPALVYLLSQAPHEAAAGSLVIVLLSALTALIAHARNNHVNWQGGFIFGVVSALAAFVGARIAPLLSGQALMLAFSGLLLAAAVFMLVRGIQSRCNEAHHGRAEPTRPDPTQSEPVQPGSAERDLDPAQEAPGSDTAGRAEPTQPEPAQPEPTQSKPTQPEPVQPEPGASRQSSRDRSEARPPRRSNPPVWQVILAGSGVGLLAGVFGVGGGFAVVPILVAVFRFSMVEAAGTSVLVMMISAVFGLLGRIGTPVAIDWPVVLVFATAAALGGLAGEPMSRKARASTLTISFGLLLLAIASLNGLIYFFCD